MEELDFYYRAYREMTAEMSKSALYSGALESIKANQNGTALHNGNTNTRVIDMEWVEKIENTLTNIDMAIREQRRFIELSEDVIPIEKAKNITNESIRHLAQHTNLIASVKGDEVTPERILQIYKDESYAIYENRFLNTLINNLLIFVTLRLNALKSALRKGV